MYVQRVYDGVQIVFVTHNWKKNEDMMNPERVTEKSSMKYVVAWAMCPVIVSSVTLGSHLYGMF